MQKRIKIKEKNKIESIQIWRRVLFHIFVVFWDPGNTLQNWKKITQWWLHITCMITHVDQAMNAINMRRGPWTRVFTSSPWKLTKLPPGRNSSRKCQWRSCSEGPWYKLRTTAPPTHSTTPKILHWPHILRQLTVSILQFIKLNQLEWTYYMWLYPHAMVYSSLQAVKSRKILTKCIAFWHFWVFLVGLIVKADENGLHLSGLRKQSIYGGYIVDKTGLQKFHTSWIH